MLKGSPPRIRLPITALLLEKIYNALSSSFNPDKVMLWAIAASAFFGFFRLGELLPESHASFNHATNLAWGDVAVDSHSDPRMIQFHLKVSKCNQFGAGVHVVVGRTGNNICPVTALLRYINVRGSQPGPFFLDSGHKTMTKPYFVAQIRQILTSLGLPQQNYAGHSFRIGAATTAAAAGVEDSTIQSLGRWHSAAFLQYIRTPKEKLAAISAVLADARPQS